MIDGVLHILKCIFLPFERCREVTLFMKSGHQIHFTVLTITVKWKVGTHEFTAINVTGSYGWPYHFILDEVEAVQARLSLRRRRMWS